MHTRSGNSHVWEFINVWAHSGQNGMRRVWKGSHEFIHVLDGLTAFRFIFLHRNALKWISVQHLKSTPISLKCKLLLVEFCCCRCRRCCCCCSLYWGCSVTPSLANEQTTSSDPRSMVHFHGQQCPFFWVSTSISLFLYSTEMMHNSLQGSVGEGPGPLYTGADSHATDSASDQLS